MEFLAFLGGKIVFIGLIGGVWLLIKRYVADQQPRIEGKLRGAYQAVVTQLQEDPSNPILLKEALRLGRKYCAFVRGRPPEGGVAIFDEVALSKDINAACAGSGVGRIVIPAAPLAALDREVRTTGNTDTGIHLETDTSTVPDDLLTSLLLHETSYREIYKDLLADAPNPDRFIVELFIFNVWITQLGYQLFSPPDKDSEWLFNYIVRRAHQLKPRFAERERIVLEPLLSDKFDALLTLRWQRFDSVIAAKVSETSIPIKELCGMAMGNCGMEPGWGLLLEFHVHAKLKFIMNHAATLR